MTTVDIVESFEIKEEEKEKHQLDGLKGKKTSIVEEGNTWTVVETNPMLMSLQNKRIVTNNDEKSLPKKSKWNVLRSIVKKKLLPRPPTLPSRNITKPPRSLKKKMSEQHFGKGKIKSYLLLNGEKKRQR